MTEALCRESFHNRGTWGDPELGVYFGWTTLQGSFCDCLPVWNEKKDILLLFSGEHIADKEEVVELKRRNHAIRKPDASYLVHLYEEHGAYDFVRRLNGCFHGALVDMRIKKAFVFNDRFGADSLYFYRTNSGIYFSPETTPLLDGCPELRAVDSHAVIETLRFGETLDQRPVLSRLEIVSPGSLWKIERGEILERGSYFQSKEWESQTLLGHDYFCERFKESLMRIVPRYLRNERPIGCQVTKGSGSRLLIASAEYPRGKVPCFGLAAGFDREISIQKMRDLAIAAGQEFHLLPGADSPECLLQSLRHSVRISGNAGDETQPDAHYLAQAARGLAPVVLSATFFDEALFSERPFRHIDLTPLILPEFLRDNLGGSLGDGAVTSQISSPLLRLQRSMRGSFRVMRSQVETRCPFIDLELLALLYRIPPGEDYCTDAVCRVLDAVDVAKGQPPKQIGAWSHAIQQFARYFSRPAQTNNHVESEQASATTAALAGTPLLVSDSREKIIRDLLSDSGSCVASYLQEKAVGRLLDEHFARHVDYSAIIGRLLVMEYFLQNVLRPQNPAASTLG